MKTHMLIHSGEKPYECNVESCSQSFRTYGHLKDHQSTHFDLRFFSCDICGLSFSRKWTLKKHSYTHTGEKPFECRVCKRKFADKSNLSTHIKKHKENSTTLNSMNTAEKQRITKEPDNYICPQDCLKEKCKCESSTNSNFRKSQSKNNPNLSTENCEMEAYLDNRDDFTLFSPRDSYETLAMMDPPDFFFVTPNHELFIDNDPIETEKTVYDLFKMVSHN
jgi:uncharacterized Zn-finger protein